MGLEACICRSIAVRWLVECAQVGVDGFGVGDVEDGVDVQGVAPVVPGLFGVTGGLMDLGETVVGTGLLVAIADLGGQSERGGVLVMCLAQLSVRVAPQVDVELAIGEPAPDSVRPPQCQRGLAHSGGAGHRGDHYRCRCVVCGASQDAVEVGQLGRPAGESVYIGG